VFDFFVRDLVNYTGKSILSYRKYSPEWQSGGRRCMTISRIRDALGLEYVCGDCSAEVISGYVGDLLSEVMAQAKPDSVWVTVQSHINILAVAAIVGIKAIVLCSGHEYPQEVVKKATNEGICLLKTQKSAFEIVGEIYSLGLR